LLQPIEKSRSHCYSNPVIATRKRALYTGEIMVLSTDPAPS
jgi:hypothetical protein